VAPHLKFPTFRLDDRFADLQIDSAALHRLRRRGDTPPYQCGDRGGSAAYDRFTVSLSTFLSFPVCGLKLLHRAECTAKEQDIRI